MFKKILVKKWNGEEEIFDEKKLRTSLRRSGASKEVINKIVLEIEKIIFNGITTQQIFKKAFSLLKKEQHHASLRYNLSTAVANLGPAGFAFEKYIGEVFKSYEYSPVYVGKMVKGKCISHEMDIVAFKGNTHVTAELKFHNSRQAKSDLKVILYMQSRFRDILDSGYYEEREPKQMIITNTKFTSNAKKYAACSDLEVLGWDFPYRNNLHDFILNSGIHPITALTTLNKKAQNYFLTKKIVSCQSLLSNNHRKLFNNPFVPRNKIQSIVDEILLICSIPTRK